MLRSDNRPGDRTVGAAHPGRRPKSSRIGSVNNGAAAPLNDDVAPRWGSRVVDPFGRYAAGATQHTRPDPDAR
jgi:hypothetical protein